MGILDGRLAAAEGLRIFSGALSIIGPTNEVHAISVGVCAGSAVSAIVLYAGWCGGTYGAMRGLQFGVLMGVFVACVHPISNLNYYEHGCETWAGNRSK
jgi:hypothetical protein